MEARREDRLGGQASVSGSRYGGSLSASYELDFWGRNRSARAAAESAWRASAHDRDTVRLTVTAGVASAWLQAVALRERADIAQSNLRAAERLLQLVDARVRAGAASPLDLAQQRGLVATQQRSLVHTGGGCGHIPAVTLGLGHQGIEFGAAQAAPPGPANPGQAPL